MKQPEPSIVSDLFPELRLFTKGLDKQEARASATVVGDQRLGLKALDMVSIIA